MLEHQQQFCLNVMESVLSVKRSGYCAWRKSGQESSERLQKQHCRDEKVKAIFELRKSRYGARRIQAELAENGEQADVKTIIISMSRQDLVAKAARKFKVTTDSDHQLPVAPNLLEQNFETTGPNQKWVGDITYLMTSEGCHYLAVIIESYSRTVVGWSMSSRMTAQLASDALTMDLFRRGRPKDVIAHSDRGSQYYSHAYRHLIEKHKLIQSMSRKACCWDNACAKSFLHSLKVEAIHDEPVTDRATTKQSAF